MPGGADGGRESLPRDPTASPLAVLVSCRHPGRELRGTHGRRRSPPPHPHAVAPTTSWTRSWTSSVLPCTAASGRHAHPPLISFRTADQSAIDNASAAAAATAWWTVRSTSAASELSSPGPPPERVAGAVRREAEVQVRCVISEHIHVGLLGMCGIAQRSRSSRENHSQRGGFRTVQVGDERYVPARLQMGEAGDRAPQHGRQPPLLVLPQPMRVKYASAISG